MPTRTPAQRRKHRSFAAIFLAVAALSLPACSNHGREFHPEYALGAAALIGIGIVAPAAFDDSPPPTYEQQVHNFYDRSGW
jgi:hypothetical protein